MKNKTGLIIIAIIATLSGQVRADSDNDTSIRDYQGRDKGQHLQIGIATAGACNLAFQSSGRCFLASEVFGLGEQLYALKTNPNKHGREAGYDFLAHTIGAYTGTVLSNGALVYFSHEQKTFSLNIFKPF